MTIISIYLYHANLDQTIFVFLDIDKNILPKCLFYFLHYSYSNPNRIFYLGKGHGLISLSAKRRLQIQMFVWKKGEMYEEIPRAKFPNSQWKCVRSEHFCVTDPLPPSREWQGLFQRALAETNQIHWFLQRKFQSWINCHSGISIYPIKR